MRATRILGSAGAAMAMAVASIGLATPGFATNDLDNLVDSLLETNPGMNRQQLLTQAEKAAAEFAMSTEEVLAQQASEAQDSRVAAGGYAAARGGGGGTVKLGSATRKGDIFISPASTLFISHGHAGIYYSTTTIVEAPGTGKASRSATASSISVGKGAVKQYVNTTQANRDKAANYAYNNMRGKKYNTNFVSNRQVPASSYNCSQLVWGAYKAATGIDLDKNGGLGVYPFDIRDSSSTVTYKTL